MRKKNNPASSLTKTGGDDSRSADPKKRTTPRRPVPKEDGMARLRPWVAAAAVIVAIYIALNPSIGYAPVPRVVLFFVLALLFTMVTAGEIDARFELTLPKFVFTSTGVVAVMCFLLWWLNHLAAAEVQATRFKLRYKGVHNLMLTRNMVDVKGMQGVSSVPYFVDGEDLY